MNHSLAVALQAKLKAIFLSASMLYQDQGVILKSQSEGKIYGLSRSRRQLYRDESLLAEEDALRMLREPEAKFLRCQVITYQGKEALVFLLPHAVHRTAGSALVLVMNPDAIANDVSNALVSDCAS